MTWPVYFFNSSEYGASLYPVMASGSAYSVGTIVRTTGSVSGQIFARCTVAGTTSSASLTESTAAPNADITNGSSSWKVISGVPGFTSDTWKVAVQNLMYFSLAAATQSYPNPKEGRLYQGVTWREGADVYVASSDALGAGLMSQTTLNNQFRNTTESTNGVDPLTVFNACLGSKPVRFISADETVASTTSGTYKRGAKLVNSSTDAFVVGQYEFYGFDISTLDCETNFFNTISNSRPVSLFYFDDCHFSVDTTGADLRKFFGFTFGYNSLMAGEELTYISRTTITNSSFTLHGQWARLAFRGVVDVENTTFSTDLPGGFGLYPPFALAFNSGYASTIAEHLDTTTIYASTPFYTVLTFTGCSFLSAMPYPFQSRFYGYARVAFKGCEFQEGDLSTCLDNIQENTIADLQVNFFGCGTAGALDPSSHLYVTPRLYARKQNGVFRRGSLPDEWGNQYSFYVKSKRRGFLPGITPEELPHLSLSVGYAKLEVAIMVAVPPDQLLTNEDFYVQFVGPDFGNQDYTTETAEYGTARVTNTSGTRNPHTEVGPQVYPVVSASWSGIPDGWVTQRVSAILLGENTGRVYAVPFLSRASTELIMCPTLWVGQVA